MIVKAGAVQEEIEVKQKCTDEDIKQLEVSKECEALANEFKSIYVAHSISPVALTFTVQCVPGSRADDKAKKDLTKRLRELKVIKYENAAAKGAIDARELQVRLQSVT